MRLERLIITHTCESDFAAAAPINWHSDYADTAHAFRGGPKLRKLKMKQSPVERGRSVNAVSMKTFEMLKAHIESQQVSVDRYGNVYN